MEEQGFEQIQLFWKPPLLATALFCLQYPEHWQVHSRTSINNHWINVLLSPTYNTDIVLGTRDNAKMSMTYSFTLFALIKHINNLEEELINSLVKWQNLEKI